MSRHTVTHACGHTQDHQLYGPYKDRDRQAARLADTACTECWRADQDRQHREANAAAAIDNAAAGLVALTGSEKQVAWAESIRKPILAALDALPADLKHPSLSPDAQAELSDAVALVICEVRDQSSARWWIDNRHELAGGDPRRLALRHVSGRLMPRLATLAPTAHAEVEAARAAKAVANG